VKTYYAHVAISVSDDSDPMDVFAYVDDAVRSWGALKAIKAPLNHAQGGEFEPWAADADTTHARDAVALNVARAIACRCRACSRSFQASSSSSAGDIRPAGV
jgi:hypothetical protein